MGVALTDERLKRIQAMVVRGETKIVRQQSLRVSERTLMLDGDQWRIMWDARRKTVITVLPLPGSLDYYEVAG